MTVLVGGLRVLGANSGGDNQSSLGVFTNRRETLSNDFFTTLLQQDIEWNKSAECTSISQEKIPLQALSNGMRHALI